jgi:hypothetical protein
LSIRNLLCISAFGIGRLERFRAVRQRVFW